MFETMFIEAVNMFVFLVVELTVLFLLISYAVGVLQEYISPQKIQNILSSKNGKGYIFAGFFGAITPFCSCSTIPILKGLLRARAGFGTMMVFLFTSPLLNPIIIGLFVATFGLNVAIFYFVISLVVSIIAGYILEKLGFEKYVKEDAYGVPLSPVFSESCSTTKAPISSESCCNTKKIEPQKIISGESCCTKKTEPQASESCSPSCGVPTSSNKWKRIWLATWSDFKDVFPYLLAGVLLGSVIYGFMPTEFVSKIANENNPFAIPIAAIIGIPLYIRAEAVIPLSAALAAKGMGLGAVMALIIGSAGASLTEVILLRSIFKTPLIIAFLAVILFMAISAGYLYQWVF